MASVRLKTPEPEPGKRTLQGIKEEIAQATGHTVSVTDLPGVMYVEWTETLEELQWRLRSTVGVYIAEVQ